MTLAMNLAMKTGRPLILMQGGEPAKAFGNKALIDGLGSQGTRERNETALNRVVLHIITYNRRDFGRQTTGIKMGITNGTVAAQIADEVRKTDDCVPTRDQMEMLTQLFNQCGSNMGGSEGEVGGSIVARDGMNRALEGWNALKYAVDAKEQEAQAREREEAPTGAGKKQ